MTELQRNNVPPSISRIYFFGKQKRSCTQLKKNFASSLLVGTLVLAQTAPAFAAGDAAGHWAQDALNTWQNYGVIQGDENGNLMPDSGITRGEMAVMLDRVMAYRLKAQNTFSDLNQSWYTDAILGANAAGIIMGMGDGTVQPGASITRQETAVMFARVLDLDTHSAPDAGFRDQASIPGWAVGAVNAMAAAGYMQGSSGLFRPADTITRAEVVTILNNIFNANYNASGEYTGDVDGSAVISADNVTLRDMHITGDLIVAEGVGEGHVELDNVTVGGRLLVRGGGANSIVIKGNSKISQVIVSRQDGKVRVAVEDSAQVSVVVVDEGSDSVKLEGALGTVSVESAGAAVEIAGKVNTVDVTASADGAAVTVSKDAAVSTLTTSAENATLTVAGNVTNVAVTAHADGTSVRTERGARIDSVTTAGANTTVAGSGTVSKVEAQSGATGTTVTTSGTKVENNSSEAVATGSGSIGSGTSGTTNRPSTGGGSSVVTTATVSSAEELNAALANSAITAIRISGTIGSEGVYEIIKVDRAVSIKGGTVYGSFVVTGDGAVIDGVTIYNRGDSSGENTAARNGINAACHTLTVKNCTFEMKSSANGISNGISIWPTQAEVNYTITGNTFTGYQTDDSGYSSVAVTISGGISKPAVTGLDAASVPASMTKEQDLAIITGNTFANCKGDYTREDWTGGNKVFCKSLSSGDNLYLEGAADTASYYITGAVTRGSDATVKAGTTLTVMEGASLTIAEGKTLTVNGALVVNGTLTNNGTITGTVTAPGYVEVDGNWVKRFESGLGTAESPYEIANNLQMSQIVNGADDEHLVYYKLTDNLDLKDSAAYTSGTPLALNIVFDGNGKTIFASEKTELNGVFGTVGGKTTIRNLTYNLTNLGMRGAFSDICGLINSASGSYADILVENVTITGSHSVASNNGPFVMTEQLANSTLTFRGCDMAADLSGVGYNSCFIGWQMATLNDKSTVCNAAIVLEDCTVSGRLVCPKASIVTANGFNATTRSYAYEGSNTLTGTVRGTEAAKYFTAVSFSSAQAQEQAAQNAFLHEGSTGSLYVGQDDSALAISVAEDGKLTVTPSDSDSVTKYEVRIGLYTTLYNNATKSENGTWLFFATQTVDKDALDSLCLYNYKFIDAGYDGLGEISMDAAGNKIASLDGATYYVVSDYIYPDASGLQGYVGSPDAPGIRGAAIIQVIAYAGDTLHSSAIYQG